MLTHLSIRDIVLIEALDLPLEAGLSVLSGETGAGKSILLDALGLALGARGDSSLVRAGAGKGSVTAVFEPAAGHAAFALLAESDISHDGEIVIRRIQAGDGKSRAFINDQPVSVGLIRQVGALLAEIHGQHDDRALVDVSNHRRLLDAFAGLDGQLRAVARAWMTLARARELRDEHQARMDRAEAERAFLEHALKELAELDPREGEEDHLAAQRQLMMHAEQFTEALGEAGDALSAGGGEGALNAALRKLERRREQAGGLLDAACQALERVVIEINEARAALDAAARAVVFDARGLERAEERLFALRALARKHKVTADELAGLRRKYEADLASIDDGGRRLAALEAEHAAALERYGLAARTLSEARMAAARRLDVAVLEELAPLRLERARFETRVETDEAKPGPTGIDRVEFLAAANPGTALSPLVKVASGGELSRFMLALKVVLAACGSAPTLVFDEIDTGVGGAVADAIGQRLARLAGGLQVLAVTHSPQVASRAGQHLLISKIEEAGGGPGRRMITRVAALSGASRREEIARMLSGAEITAEARAQAERLLAEAG